ncbi:uncharacterized protein LACBIDRAFT_329556 [Laccaria bicolor S238N-H82]|uniref:Predicted protein n=1 Tax=Laccaria bicolor (strain S238N-H82 / ATCC MYA-4686) TaxID=486041 RepID=B0DIE5_LACBS|nr:uncharacterized protein LACBIDRAFT_329556 [Laccaria bicolor S238N-H82]EDR05550.1 predicted protein [Laccaria bicolor S238N-H82]|eukprot:XP_001883654.1 predicted protein [Laccaria bicolor S238N-H82]
MIRRVWSGFGLDGVDGTSFTWDLFTSYLTNRRPDCSRLFCAGKPSFTPFFGPPELAKRSPIGGASPSSAWHDQDEHISSVLGEIFVVPVTFFGDLFMSYLADRRPDRSRLFCVGQPSFTPFFGPPELAKRSPIGGASPSSTWHGQNEHISSALGEILVVPFVLWFVLKPRSMRFWEALIRVKRTGGSCVTVPSLQQPFTGDLFMSYLADRRSDRSHLFCVGQPSFTPFFGLPELAKRSPIGGASPSSACYGQDEHISSVLGEIFVAPFVL